LRTAGWAVADQPIVTYCGLCTDMVEGSAGDMGVPSMHKAVVQMWEASELQLGSLAWQRSLYS
jgi:hypothetical protein